MAKVQLLACVSFRDSYYKGKPEYDSVINHTIGLRPNYFISEELLLFIYPALSFLMITDSTKCIPVNYVVAPTLYWAEVGLSQLFRLIPKYLDIILIGPSRLLVTFLPEGVIVGF